jgi:hypothetical protein
MASPMLAGLGGFWTLAYEVLDMYWTQETPQPMRVNTFDQSKMDT